MLINITSIVIIIIIIIIISIIIIIIIIKMNSFALFRLLLTVR